MKIAKIIAAMRLLAAGAFGTEAQATTLRCDGCSGPEMQEWAIMQAAQNGYTYDEVYVINQTDNFMKKFIVTVDAGGGDIPDQIPDGTSYGTATEVPVPATELQYFSVALVVNGQIIAMASGLPGSMYDVVNNPSADFALSEYARTTPQAHGQTLLDFLSALKFSLLDFSKIDISIRLVASDNSYATLVFDPVAKKWERLKNETRDSSGNVIPSTKTEVTGGSNSYREYTFNNPNDFTSFVQHVGNLGVVFVGSVGTWAVRQVWSVLRSSRAPKARSPAKKRSAQRPIELEA
ncbi:hypothetical protein JAK45_05565 [Stenotrophomonas maltophilia]|nr:hypothetical protein [Stenotrophomonas maltophilia]